MATDQSYLASVDMWAPNFAPRNWAYCHGQLLSISQNSALYSLLGIAYGGDGRATFGLPEMRGRTPVGRGVLPGGDNYVLGAKGGQENVTLTLAQMPRHSHSGTFTPGGSITGTLSIPVQTGSATGTNTPVGKYFGKTNDTNLYYDDYTADSYMGPVDFDVEQGTGTVTLSETGSNQSFSVLQPYSVLHFIICTAGLFPPRS